MSHNSNGNGKTELMQNAEAALKAKASMLDPAEDRPKIRTAHEGIFYCQTRISPLPGHLSEKVSGQSWSGADRRADAETTPNG